MTREQQAEYLKEQLAALLNDKKENPNNEILICHVDKDLFIEMSFCFISKHGK
jgi:hypothetical protein